MRCEVCGNDYDKAFEVVVDGVSRVFDSFECAIERLAPRCHRCKTRIMGHGVEVGTAYYCGAHCAKQEGITSVQDRAVQ